jgi:hypothetical protein
MTEETVAALVVIVAVAVIAPFVADRVHPWLAIPLSVPGWVVSLLVGIGLGLLLARARKPDWS